MLLVNYFPSEFTHGDQDLIEMLIATATVWLDLCDIQLASRNIVVDVLEKMVRAADALSRESALAPLDSVVGVSQGGGSLEVGAGHRRWILQLDWKSETLKSRYGALYRQLLHALAKAYKLGKLRGDQNLIRECLHNMLDASHKNSEYEYTCEVDACPWTGHSNPYRHEGYHHVKCDLLAKSAKPASAAGARDRESPSGSELRLSSLSPNLAISSDPPQGLTHAAPYRTTAHELEGFLAPVIDTPGYRSLRSSLPATEHEARRHAIAMVRDARSMEQLTRPEAVQVAPGRRRSWG
ncbi:uncharacterized protein PHACADRAFT_251106 [Phanerochaete carnosa HHB-10118-sp]|uniref:Uncharacterized protein n=1 Tax=Phanerochaete carnosa (strain HHB-10118-sp) TaxID=650164 RepID=K5WDT8_PHACS|nr:uncharacterized protein PHACADRAFT_251106 [Phanerochaete carnosa HHB-10118-sp]EKM57445.1 hypothetical protein PHACADRAFT_251106 [Phanerochaete carnosa HHB-10118-sp]